MVLLIEVVEREIFVVVTFENEELAEDEMELRLASHLGLDGIPYNWEDIEDYDRYNDFDIQPDSAWINDCYGNNYDWKIVNI